jgi:STE24 endopeptidase
VADNINDVADGPRELPNGNPSDSAGEMSREQLAEAKAYGRRELVCSLVDKGLDVGFLALMAFVFAVPLDQWLAGFAESATLRLALMFLFLTVLHIAISFPLALYSGHILEHRFGLSHLTFGRWLARYAKRNLLAIVFGLLMFVGLYWVIWLAGDWWWLAAAGAFFVVSVVFGQLMPVLILPMFYKIERLENPELAERMSRLAEGTGLSIQGVYRMGLSEETAKANAMLTGVGRTLRVLMGDTVLDEFSPDEIEVIFAHEIGHHVFRHIRKMIAAGVVYSVVGFWLCDRIVLAWAQSNYGDQIDAHEMPVGTLPLLMFALTVFALLLEPLQNAISRRYERQCDRYALERTGLKQAYISAFRKLARLNKDDPDPHPLEVFLFHSHPPISERLAMAND